MCAFSSSHQACLEEDAGSRKPTKPPQTSVTSSGRRSSAPSQKQVKRRHRRKKSTGSANDCGESKQEQTDRSERSLSSDRSEHGEKRERSSRTRRELPPRLRCSAAAKTDSSSEEEARREARSWSKEKARRGRCRSGSSREQDGPSEVKGEEERTEVMVLQSVDSEEEGKEQRCLVEDTGGLKRRHNSQASAKGDGRNSQSENKNSCKSHDPEDSSSLAEDGEEHITKKYQEKGSGGGDMAVPSDHKPCGVNGSAPMPYSDDSEMEVCRLVCVFRRSVTPQVPIGHQVQPFLRRQRSF